MKIPVPFLAALIVTGLVAGPVSAAICSPDADVALGRDQFRQKSATVAVGTVKGTVGLSGILFSDFTGTFDVQLFLFFDDAMGNPAGLIPGPVFPVALNRGKWVGRSGAASTPDSIEATSVTLRPSHTGDTASLTIKFQVELPDGAAWGVDVFPTGVALLNALQDGTDGCGTGPVNIQALADLTD